MGESDIQEKKILLESLEEEVTLETVSRTLDLEEIISTFKNDPGLIKELGTGLVVLSFTGKLIGVGGALLPSVIFLLGAGVAGAAVIGLAFTKKEAIETVMKRIFQNRGFRVMTENGSKVYPRLLKKEDTDYGYKLVYSLPLGISDEDLWKIWRGIEIGTNSELEMFTENSEVHLKFFTHPLPSKPVNFNMKYLEKGREGKMILPIIMGMSRAGFEIFDLAGAPSALIGGESGGGKTTLFRVIIANLVHRSNCELYVVDVTRKLAYMKAQGWFEAELEGIDDMLGYLYQEMYDRYKAFEDIGVDEISGLSEEEQLEFPRIVLLIDEFNGLSPSMVKGDTPERAIRNNIVNKIAHLITKGRGCGIHLVVGLQRPDARLMEDGQIKANMSVRIAFRTTDASNSKIILDNSMAAAIPADIPGRCVLRGKDRIRQVQVFNLDYQTAKKLLPKEPKNVRKSYIPPNPLEFLIK